MSVYPNWGEENPERARLCKMCGAALGSVPGEVVEERKIVSVLFTTLLASPLDPTRRPEDVRASLAPYHQMVRAESERYGGTVEKSVQEFPRRTGRNDVQPKVVTIAQKRGRR